jgi:hypothetical protein
VATSDEACGSASNGVHHPQRPRRDPGSTYSTGRLDAALVAIDRNTVERMQFVCG